MSAAKPITTAERIQRAREELDAGAVDYAQASALIAIAELLQTNIAETYTNGVLAGAEAGATAVSEALATVTGLAFGNGSSPPPATVSQDPPWVDPTSYEDR